MKKELERLMDWPEIEAIVYSECREPGYTLGPHPTDDGMLIQAFIPDAVSADTVFADGKRFSMEMADEQGFFAVLVPGHKIPSYVFEAMYADDSKAVIQDPYRFASVYKDSDLVKFSAGIHYDIYKKMGAHPMRISGVDGVLFAVWAPNAVRVSVVGDFNNWDGRTCQMNYLGDSGIFELFVPGVEAGALYKYEVKFKGGLPALKADPYAFQTEVMPATASVVYDHSKYKWKDAAWRVSARNAAKKGTLTDGPMNIYELHMGSWKRPGGADCMPRYTEIAKELAPYLKKMGYTHVEVMPVMEYREDWSLGYETTGYYAPTSRYGTPDDLKSFVDTMHSEGIGVIFDWMAAYFANEGFALADLDGTGLYEHKDPRRGMSADGRKLLFNYGRPEVSNFLIANAFYWVEEFHADGLHIPSVESMLYLDYGKNDGEWIPNMYGGNEDLEAIEFLRHLNSIFKKKKEPAFISCEETTGWPMVTGSVLDGALGFDLKWNNGWKNDLMDYMRRSAPQRPMYYGDLTFSLCYAYSEDFILPLSHDLVTDGKDQLLAAMPGSDLSDRLSDLRAAYGFAITHPGKKLLFMGQEFGQEAAWDENSELSWDLLSEEANSGLAEYVKDLNRLYLEQPALTALDDMPAGFEWVNCTSSEEGIIVFLRRSKKKEDTLLVVCNFMPYEHEAFEVGVPYAGKYKELLNSDAKKYGGSGATNPRMKQSKAVECDERKDSMTIKVAPKAVQIFKYIPAASGTATNAAAKKGQKPAKKADTAGVEKIKKAIAGGNE